MPKGRPISVPRTWPGHRDYEPRAARKQPRDKTPEPRPGRKQPVDNGVDTGDPLDVPVEADDTAEVFSPAWLGTGPETEQ